jgi:hypothetical protein
MEIVGKVPWIQKLKNEIIVKAYKLSTQRGKWQQLVYLFDQEIKIESEKDIKDEEFTKKITTEKLVEMLENILPSAQDENADWVDVAKVLKEIERRKREGENIEVLVFYGYNMKQSIKIEQAGIKMVNKPLKEVGMFPSEYLNFALEVVNQYNFSDREKKTLEYALENSLLQHASQGVVFVVKQWDDSNSRITVMDNGEGAIHKKNGQRVDTKYLFGESSYGVGGRFGKGIPLATQSASIVVIKQPGGWAIAQGGLSYDDPEDAPIFLREGNNNKNNGFVFTSFFVADKYKKLFLDPNLLYERTAILSGENLEEQVSYMIKDIAEKDQAMAVKSDDEKVGWIDLNAENLKIENRGETVEFKTPLNFEALKNADGFTPVIINIVPVTDVMLLLGLKNKEKKEKEG